MKKLVIYLMLLCGVISLSGCATILTKGQTVHVDSDVEGAAVYKGRKFVGYTPCTFKTKAAKSTMTVSYGGVSQTINTDVDIRWNVAWNWFNGVWVGWMIDAITGATQKYTKTNYFISLRNPEQNVAYNNAHQNQAIGRIDPPKTPEEAAERQAALMNILGTVAAMPGQLKAAHEADKAAEEAKRQEFRNRYLNNNTNSSNYQQSQRNTNVNSGTSSSYNSSGSYNQQSQSIPREWLTSDPEWNRAVQMSVQQYGLEATRKIIEQKRHNDMTEYDGQVITGMTSSGAAVKLKVKDGRVVAWAKSTGFGTDYIQWEKTGATIYGSSRFSGYNKSDFKYAAEVTGLGVVFFDL